MEVVHYGTKDIDTAFLNTTHSINKAVEMLAI